MKALLLYRSLIYYALVPTWRSSPHCFDGFCLDQ